MTRSSTSATGTPTIRSAMSPGSWEAFFRTADVRVGGRSPDERSYRVSFSKIHELLPDFACDWTVERGAHELRERFAAVGLTADEFLSRDFTRLKQIEHLRAANEIDESFFWTTARMSTDRATQP